MNESLITKYRPQAFTEVLGNQSVIKGLEDALSKSTRHHSYLLTGGSGIGKTTLARIIAKAVNADVMEIDAASHSGVDDVRGLVERAGYKPITGKNVMYILDECHALSKNAWQALLKIIEEPPDHLFIALCTTESTKVPETIKNRCHPVVLKNLRPNEIEELLDTVIQVEQMKVENDTFNAIVQASGGSARKALSILQAGHSAKTRDELSKVIMEVETDSSPITEICKLLLTNNKSWPKYAKLLGEIENEEEALIMATRYLTGALLKTNNELDACRCVAMLETFIMQNGWDKKVQLVFAVSKIVLLLK